MQFQQKFKIRSSDEVAKLGRLYTVLEKVLGEISFYAPEYEQKEFRVTSDYVKSVFRSEEEDLKKDTSRFII